MRFRTGFVSNSSSASFLIPIGKYNESQLDAIGLRYNALDYDEKWTLSVDDEGIHLSTIIDNFDFQTFLIEIGIKNEDIKNSGEEPWW